MAAARVRKEFALSIEPIATSACAAESCSPRSLGAALAASL